jgi:hypothetical protein
MEVLESLGLLPKLAKHMEAEVAPTIRTLIDADVFSIFIESAAVPWSCWTSTAGARCGFVRRISFPWFVNAVIV